MPHLLGGKDAKFNVFRYKIPDDHWAAKEGWLLGLVGPMDEKDESYSYLPGAFSHVGDTEGSIPINELVSWYVGMLEKKGIVE